MLLVPGMANAAANTDSVVGSGLAPLFLNQPLNFSATSNPAGKHATGTFDNGYYAGTVTCLKVNGNRATIGGVITSSANNFLWNFPVGTGVLLAVVDYGDFGPGVFQDLFAQQSLPNPATAADCQRVVTEPYARVNGGIVVTDAKP